MRRIIVASLGLAFLGAACAPDPLDTYGVTEEVPATLAPLPTTTAPSGEDIEPAPTFPSNGETVEVRALDNSFVAQSVEVEAGTEILWSNAGRNDHNVLPVDESLGWGVEREDFVPTDEYSWVFDQPGVYPYYCSIHGTKEVGMVGAVIVTEPA